MDKELPLRLSEFGNSSTVARRRLLGLSGAVGLAIMGATGCAAGRTGEAGSDHVDTSPSVGGSGHVTAPRPVGVLGGNFNQNLASLNFAELQAVSASWVRGFFPTPDADRGDLADAPSIRTLVNAGEQGYGTVLSLKFPFNHKPLPSPGSPAMAAEIKRLDKILPAVMDKADILVVGNEPFIETRTKDWGRINAFYETIAHQVISYREKNFSEKCKTQIYMGALNHLDLPAWRTPATDRWMAFARNTPSIDGVDIHPHLPAPGADRPYLDYIIPRMRADQKFLATEFSLVLFWKKHLKDPVLATFTDRYGMRRGIPVWQVAKEAIEQHFTQKKWNDFLSACPWFENNKGYLRDQVERFRGTGRLAVATYGLAQGAAMVKDFGPQKTPWLFNSLFCPYTVQRGEDGLPGRTQAWTDEFHALQHS